MHTCIDQRTDKHMCLSVCICIYILCTCIQMQTCNLVDNP